MIDCLTQSVLNLLEFEKNSGTNSSIDGQTFDITVIRPSNNVLNGNSALNLFLYDVREDLEVRMTQSYYYNSNEQSLQKDPLHIKCSYLVTAWAGNGSDNTAPDSSEYVILDWAVSVLRKYSVLPLTLTDSLGNAVPILYGDLAKSRPAA